MLEYARGSQQPPMRGVSANRAGARGPSKTSYEARYLRHVPYDVSLWHLDLAGGTRSPGLADGGLDVGDRAEAAVQVAPLQRVEGVRYDVAVARGAGPEGGDLLVGPELEDLLERAAEVLGLSGREAPGLRTAQDPVDRRAARVPDDQGDPAAEQDRRPQATALEIELASTFTRALDRELTHDSSLGLHAEAERQQRGEEPAIARRGQHRLR